MTTPFDDMHCEYGWASGSHFMDCAFVARRWRDRYGTMLSDSDFYVCAVTNDEVRYWGPWPNIVPALWRALPSGRVYVCDASQGAVHIYDDVMNTDPSLIRRVELGFAPEGIWGLDERHIYVWGIRRPASGDKVPALARFDGTSWLDMATPSFFITKMHGLSPDLIYGAGRGGMARWDGRGWNELPMPTGEILSDVFVAGPDEIYATGHSGSLLEGTANGWGVIARTPDDRLPYACVAKFAGELFVGGGPLGLFRRVGKTDQLELIKPNIQATGFEVRGGALIITAPTKIVGTADGLKFQSTVVDVVLNATNTVDIALR